MKPEWDQQLRDAEAAGDSARVEELKLFMPSFQHLLHQQVFSTGSICNVLREIEGDLPGIAAEADVDLIVSRWELPYRAPDVEPVPLEEMLYQPEH